MLFNKLFSYLCNTVCSKEMMKNKQYDSHVADVSHVSESAFAYVGAVPVAGALPQHPSFAMENVTDRSTQNRMTYFVYCINAFAERYGLSSKQAFAYLHRFKGLDFLEECYEAEHQLSIREAVNDLSIICKRNGGALE